MGRLTTWRTGFTGDPRQVQCFQFRDKISLLFDDFVLFFSHINKYRPWSFEILRDHFCYYVFKNLADDIISSFNYAMNATVGFYMTRARFLEIILRTRL